MEDLTIKFHTLFESKGIKLRFMFFLDDVPPIFETISQFVHKYKVLLMKTEWYLHTTDLIDQFIRDTVALSQVEFSQFKCSFEPRMYCV